MQPWDHLGDAGMGGWGCLLWWQRRGCLEGVVTLCVGTARNALSRVLGSALGECEWTRCVWEVESTKMVYREGGVM